jgi:hypothetical protein
MDLNLRSLKTEYHDLHPKTSSFLTAPASVSFKKRGSKRFARSINCKAYAHMGYDSLGRIYFFITGNTHNDDFRIVISKWHILQMLKLHLTLRPIRKANDCKLWFNENQLSKAEIEKIDLESITFKELSEEHKKIKEKLERNIQRASPEDKRKAERQLQELIELQCKIDILKGIDNAKKALKAASENEKKRDQVKTGKNKLLELPKLPEYPELMEITGKWKNR